MIIWFLCMIVLCMALDTGFLLNPDLDPGFQNLIKNFSWTHKTNLLVQITLLHEFKLKKPNGPLIKHENSSFFFTYFVC